MGKSFLGILFDPFLLGFVSAQVTVHSLQRIQNYGLWPFYALCRGPLYHEWETLPCHCKCFDVKPEDLIP